MSEVEEWTPPEVKTNGWTPPEAEKKSPDQNGIQISDSNSTSTAPISVSESQEPQPQQATSLQSSPSKSPLLNPKVSPLDRRLPYLTEQAAKSFQEHPEIFSNRNARQKYYERLAKPYHGRDYFKVLAALQSVDPYAKQEAQEGIIEGINPLGQTIPTAVKSAVSGVTHGVEQLGQTEKVAAKEGMGSGLLNIGVGLGHTALGLAGVVVPELAAFNIAAQGLEETAPEAAQWLAPASTLIVRHYKDKPIPKWVENTGAVFDFAANLGVFVGARLAIKKLSVKEVIDQATPEEIKKAVEQTEAKFTPHPDEVKAETIENDIAKNPDSPVVPILKQEADNLQKKVADEQLIKATAEAELTSLNEQKAQLEKEIEPLSEESKKIIQPTIDELSGKIKTMSDELKIGDTVEMEVTKSERGEISFTELEAGAVGKGDARPLEGKEIKEPPIETAATIEETNRVAELVGLGEYIREPQTVKGWNEQADKRIVENKNIIPDTIQKIKEGKGDAVDQIILGRQLASIDAEMRTKGATDDLIKLYKEAKDVNDLVLGATAGRILRSRQEFRPVENSLGDMMTEKMQSVGVDKLTDVQKESVVKSYTEIAKAREAADAKVAELQAKVIDLESRKQFERIVRGKKRNFSKEKLDQEFSELATELSKISKESFVAGAGINPVLASKASVVIAKMVRNRVEKGVIKLSEVVESVYEKAKEFGLSKQDIHDVIAGKYNEKKQTKNEITGQLRDLKTEAQLINKLEALERGEVPVKEMAKVERNRRLKELRDKIKDIGVDDLQTIKKRNEAATEKLEKKIADKDYVTQKRTSLLEDPEIKKRFPELRNEALDALRKKEDTRHQWEIDKMKDVLANRGIVEKIYDFAKHVVTTARSIMAGIDDSFAFIQAGMSAVTHPIHFSRSWVDHWKDFLSEKRYERELTAMHNAPYWDLVKKSELDILEPKSLKEKEREGLLDYNLLDEDIKIKGKKFNVGKWTTRPFVRAFISMGNNLRLRLFLEQSDILFDQKKTFVTHPQEFKDIATAINTETGRGKVHKLFDNDLVRITIWSPRLLSSGLNTLGIGDVGNLALGQKGYYAKLTPHARNYAIRQTVKGISIGLTTMALIRYNGGGADFDPRSVTFGDVWFSDDGDHYNIFGRFAPIVKYIAMSATRKKLYPDGGEKKTNFGAETLRFTRGKTAPIVGYGIDASTGKTYMGKDFDAVEGAKGLFTPLSIKSIIQGLEQSGVISLLQRGIFSFEGIKVSNQKDFDKPVVQGSDLNKKIKKKFTMPKRKATKKKNETK